MSNNNLHSLVGKLNKVCIRSLENATQFCAQQGHSWLELEHWLLKLLEEPDTKLQALLQAFAVNKEQLKTELLRNLAKLETKNNSTPAFSQSLIELIETAWQTSSLTFNANEIDTGYLFYSLFQQPQWQRVAYQLAPQLRKIIPEQLKAEFLTITAAINETQQNKSDANLLLSPEGSALNNYTIDLTQQAKAGQLDPVYGRDSEVRQIIDILMRRRQNNPILVGEAGVGKTAIVEGLALRVAAGTIPDKLKNVRVCLLDLTLLQAGAHMKGEFENRLKTLIKEIKQSPVPIILFMDEAHTLVGAGGQAGQNDAANILKPALARGELRTIGATTWSEYKKYIEKDAALTRRFQLVKVAEPDEVTAIAMLENMVNVLEKHHLTKITKEAIIAAVRLSIRYLPERHLPDKAISLVDTACARVYNDAAISKKMVDEKIIAEVISSWTGIPIGNIQQNEIAGLLNVEKILNDKVLGQSHALSQIAHAIQAARTNLTDPQKPVGVFLLVGSSGIGKTETAVTLAETLYGDKQALTVINMAEFKEQHKISLLTGSPAGYVGYGEGGVLTEAVRRRPYSVVLLDEMEKAHPAVQDVFYRAFDKGVLMDSEGTLIDFSNTVIIMTANLGEETIEQWTKAHSDVVLDELNNTLQPVLLRTFSPAFLGRVTVVPYVPLKPKVMQEIIQQQMAKLQHRIEQNYGAEVTYSATFTEFLLKSCADWQTGARQINNVISNKVLPLLATEFLKKLALGKPITKVYITLNKQHELNITVQTKKEIKQKPEKKIYA